jgi:hypothetical protein
MPSAASRAARVGDAGALAEALDVDESSTASPTCAVSAVELEP